MPRAMRERISNIVQARLGQVQTSSSLRLSSIDEAYIVVDIVHLLGLDRLLGIYPGSEKGDGDDID